MNSPFLAVVLLLLLATTCKAKAQEPPSLEQLLNAPLTGIPTQVEVSTASRFAQSSSHSANITYVVTATDIDLYQWTTLAQILQSLPGIYISTDGVFQYMSVRGLGQPGDFNSRLLFLIDGVRINENIYDAALLGTDAIIDVENIARVEFAAGPGAAAYGNNAFFGVVNILTKTAQQLRGGALRLSTQTDGSNRYFFNTASRLEQGSEWWLSASYQHQNEIPLVFDSPSGYEQQFLQLNNEQVSRVRLGGKHLGLQLQALWSSQLRTTPQLLPTPDGLKAMPVDDENNNLLLSVAFSQQLTNDLALSSHLNYSSSEFRREIAIFHPVFDLTSVQSEQLGAWYSGDLLLKYQGFAEHDLLAGVEFQDDVRQQIETRLHDDAGLLEGYYGHNRRKSLYIQDNWQFSHSQSLLLGARLDDSNLSGQRLSPRLGWVWQWSEMQQLKLLYGSAYRSANLYEFSTNYNFDQPLPQDEEITSAEISFEQRVSSQFSYRLSWFDADMRQLIRMAPDQAVFSNASRLHQHGSNIDFDWRFDNGRQVTAAWSWQQGSDDSGYPLQNSPRHLLKMQYLQPLSWLHGQFSMQLLSVSRRQAGDSTLPGYTLLHAGLSVTLHDDHQLVLHLYNLLDKVAYDRPVLINQPSAQPGRALSLSWRWQLW